MFKRLLVQTFQIVVAQVKRVQVGAEILFGKRILINRSQAQVLHRQRFDIEIGENILGHSLK